MRPDPTEEIVADALTRAGIRFVRSKRDYALDFELPDFNTCIEVKQFWTERIAKQMSRHPNVIAIQGREAARAFADWITKR